MMHDIRLGDYLDESTGLREDFYKAFNDPKSPKEGREELVKLMEV